MTVEELPEYKGQGESLLLVAKDKEEAEAVSVMANSGSIKSSLLVSWRDEKGDLRLLFGKEVVPSCSPPSGLCRKFPVAATALPTLKRER